MFGVDRWRKALWGTGRRWCVRGLASLLLGAMVLAGCGEGKRPDPCLTDADCLLKGEICRGNLCVQQESCEQDSDCKFKGEVCREKLCTTDTGTTKPPPSGCATSCSNDNECSKCDNDRKKCVSGACVKAERSAPYTRCGADVGKACADGAVCSGSEKARYCLPECDPKQKRCSDGKSGCFDPNGIGRGLCVPDGEANEGDACSPNFTGDAKIDTKKFCRATLFCGSNQKCQKIQEVGKYEACRTGKTCKSGMNCTILSQAATEGYCLPECDPKQPACDGGNGKCVQSSSGKGVCLPAGTGKEDQKCGPSGSVLKPDQFCGTGLQCVGLSADGAVCLKLVAQCAQDSCAQGRVCLSGQSGGVCALACQAGGNNCPNGLKCLQIQAGGQAVNVCGP